MAVIHIHKQEKKINTKEYQLMRLGQFMTK